MTSLVCTGLYWGFEVIFSICVYFYAHMMNDLALEDFVCVCVCVCCCVCVCVCVCVYLYVHILSYIICVFVYV